MLFKQIPSAGVSATTEHTDSQSQPHLRARSRRDLLTLGAVATGMVGAAAMTTAIVRADNEAPFLAESVQTSQKATVTLPPISVIALNRLAWGPKPGDTNTSIEAFNALGADDGTRLSAYVTQQLDPTFVATADDADTRLTAAAANLPSLGLSLPQLWTTYYTPQNATRTRPTQDVRVAALIRAVFSRRQLYEVLVDFWHNHFSIYAWGNDYASATWATYDRDVIRPNALGNFHALLQGVAQSTAMLYYLSNYISQGALFNENWGRELMELHTLGVENYLGPKDPTSVPADPASPLGLAVGYVDNDVYEAARCFTGWRINNGQSGAPGNDGTYFYYQQWHDRANKLFLKQYIPADQAQEQDGKHVLDLLAQHPGTARFVVRKLWRRLISDNVPAPGTPNALFDAVVKTFSNNWQAPNQIQLVVQQLLLGVPASGSTLAIPSPFGTTWGEKIKRPHEVLYSALRTVGADIKVDGAGLSTLWTSYDAMGQQQFGRRSPDGYPDVHDAWTNTTSMLYRWRTISNLLENAFYNPTALTGVQVDNNALLAASSVNTPSSLADFWIARTLGRAMDDPAHRAQIVTLLQGWDTGNPATSAKPIYATDAVMAPADIANRLRRMIAVILMAPEFQQK